MSRKHRKKEQKHNPQEPVTAKVEQEAIPHLATAQPKNEVKPISQEKSKSWMPAATLIATVVIAIIYYYQLLAMRHSNDINREALQSVQRAFVSCQNVNTDRKSHRLAKHSPHYWDISVSLENSGTTPAITAISYYQTAKLSAEPTEEIFRGPKEGMSSPVSIGPKSLQNLGARPTEELLLLGTDLNDDLSNAASITIPDNFFVWGWVVYRDVFSSTPPRLTEYCRTLKHASLMIDSAKPSHVSPATQVNFLWEACREHNCTDHECKDYDAVVETALSSNK
jgi:hypothetical protein